MTPTEWAFIIAATGVTINGIVTNFYASKNGKKLDKANEKADVANQKADVADTKLDQIHVLTNSNLTAATDRIAKLEEMLRKVVGDVEAAGEPTIVIPQAKMEKVQSTIQDAREMTGEEKPP